MAERGEEEGGKADYYSGYNSLFIMLSHSALLHATLSNCTQKGVIKKTKAVVHA